MFGHDDSTNGEESRVIYTLIQDDELIVIENVPARIDPETGDQFFSPSTVEKLQAIVWSKRTPKRFIQTPVYEFAG